MASFFGSHTDPCGRYAGDIERVAVIEQAPPADCRLPGIVQKISTARLITGREDRVSTRDLACLDLESTGLDTTTLTPPTGSRCDWPSSCEREVYV